MESVRLEKPGGERLRMVERRTRKHTEREVLSGS